MAIFPRCPGIRGPALYEVGKLISKYQSHGYHAILLLESRRHSAVIGGVRWNMLLPDGLLDTYECSYVQHCNPILYHMFANRVVQSSDTPQPAIKLHLHPSCSLLQLPSWMKSAHLQPEYIYRLLGQRYHKPLPLSDYQYSGFASVQSLLPSLDFFAYRFSSPQPCVRSLALSIPSRCLQSPRREHQLSAVVAA